MNYPIMFHDRDNKKKLMSASFSYFLQLLFEKKNAKNCVILITCIISLHYKGDNKTVLFTLLLQKSS